MGHFLSEKTIEDILASDKSIVAEILGLIPANLSLIARQKVLNSGKLDLLYLYDDELLLIELKVVRFYADIITQINGYYNDLHSLQKQHKIIDANIKKVILTIGFDVEDLAKCEQNSIHLEVYEPEFVLSRYYENFKEFAYFLSIKSGDYGVVRLGLLKPVLRHLKLGKNVYHIYQAGIVKSKKTLANRLAVAIQLNIVAKFKRQYFLTDFGETFVDVFNEDDDRLNEKQADLLSKFIIEHPFYSSITYTILAMVETVFVLAKSIYPVPRDAVEDYFVKSVGKSSTWKADKARATATYIFSNYACELGFLAKVDNNFYITPKGIQAILLLQLNRSIKLIEAQQ